jgi:hypothetical protein
MDKQLKIQVVIIVEDIGYTKLSDIVGKG